MTSSHALHLSPSGAAGQTAVQDIWAIVPGSAQSLCPRTPMALRVMQGRAWITLDDAPGAEQDQAAGDLFLHAGQTLWVAAGQRAVVEPLGQELLQFRWRPSSAVRQGESLTPVPQATP